MTEKLIQNKKGTVFTAPFVTGLVAFASASVSSSFKSPSKISGYTNIKHLMN